MPPPSLTPPAATCPFAVSGSLSPAARRCADTSAPGSARRCSVRGPWAQPATALALHTPTPGATPPAPGRRHGLSLSQVSSAAAGQRFVVSGRVSAGAWGRRADKLREGSE